MNLIIPGVALALAALLVVMARSRARRRRPNLPPERAVSFGYKNAWLAIQGSSPEAVIRALGLRNVKSCGWWEGLEASRQAFSTCFVSPPVDGWIFVVSLGLPEMGSTRHPNEIVPFIRQLSAELDTVVQYFASHRVVEYQAWAWAERGRVLRAYGYLGEQGVTLANEGAPTPVEQGLGLSFFEPFAEEHLTDEAFEDLVYPGEGEVMAVAGAWSIDPTTLDERELVIGTGWLGTR